MSTEAKKNAAIALLNDAVSLSIISSSFIFCLKSSQSEILFIEQERFIFLFIIHGKIIHTKKDSMSPRGNVADLHLSCWHRHKAGFLMTCVN